MILTVTPNPTVDRVFFVRHFRLDATIRGEREVVAPAGKGVCASVVIHELGGDTLATGLNAGPTGRLLTDILDEMQIRHDFLPACGETRTAVVLVDLAAGDQSTILAPTLSATGEHLSQLHAVLDRYADRTWGVIFGGTLPPGLPADSHARLIRHARRLGLITLLDSSGESLVQGVAGLPHILKVNRVELNALDPEVAGRVDDMAELGEKLTNRWGEWASGALIVTLGEQGALAVTPAGTYYAHPPKVPVVNTAGAGDAVSGAIMLARSRSADWPEALALATAAAASVVMNEGTAICQREQVQDLLPQVQVENRFAVGASAP